MKKTIVFLTILLSLTNCNSPDKGDRKSDIEFIKSELPKLHYDLFYKLSKEKFFNELDILKSDALNISDKNFVLRLQEIFTKIGDSHTSISYLKYLNNKKSYLLKLYWFVDGFYVLAIHKEYEEVLGKKLHSINGVLVDEILNRFERIVVPDNDAILKQRVPNLIASKDILDYLKITNDSLNIFEFSVNNEIVEIQPKIADKIENLKNIVKLEPTELPLSLQIKRRMFWFNYLEKEDAVYVQYNKCWGKELEQLYGSERTAQILPSFAEFSDSLIESINKNKPSKLIFDIRFNPGGSSPQGTELVQKLSEISEINQSGKIFVIIGRRTFSSAVINAMNFKEKTKAILIGESTSGAPNHFGEVKNILLPATKIKLSYSTKYFKYTESIGNTIEPDIIIEQSIDDYLKGNDPILQFIYNYQNGL